MSTTNLISTQATIGTEASNRIATETGCTILSEYAVGGIRYTTFQLTDFAVAVANTGASGGSKFATFPEGVICILSACGLPAITTTSTLSSTINASSVGNWGVGSVVGSAGTLSSTMQNVIPTTNFTSSATVSVAATATHGSLAVPLSLDGHTTAVPLYFNIGFAESNDIDADATTTVTGPIRVAWLWNGDLG